MSEFGAIFTNAMFYKCCAIVAVSWALTVGGPVDSAATIYRAVDDVHVHAQKVHRVVATAQ